VRSHLETGKDDTDPGVIFSVIEHMQWLSESQVAHDIEGGEVVHPDHVELRGWILFDGVFHGRYKFVDVLDEEGLLLFQGSVGERGREDLALATVVWVGSNDEAEFPIGCCAIPHPGFLRNMSCRAFGTMAVDLEGG